MDLYKGKTLLLIQVIMRAFLPLFFGVTVLGAVVPPVTPAPNIVTNSGPDLEIDFGNLPEPARKVLQVLDEIEDALDEIKNDHPEWMEPLKIRLKNHFKPSIISNEESDSKEESEARDGSPGPGRPASTSTKVIIHTPTVTIHKTITLMPKTFVTATLSES
ncbi:hypothetical protein H2203_000622 [Taxawa tesnikishii (nom. ined.)]|nr:hypothetical protein H2203_000622 [Dothideales sp. JES 119]